MPDFSKMTKAEMVQYAAENDITLYPSDNTRAEIIARIEAAISAQSPSVDEETLPVDETAPADENAEQNEEQGEQAEEKGVEAALADENAEQIGNYEKRRITISNPTLSVRGIMLKKGVMFLEPGEEKLVPEEDEDEIRSLFKTATFQAAVDSGLLRFSGIGDAELVEQVTPEPPSSLVGGVQVGDTGLVVGVNSTRQYDPDSGIQMQNAGYMPIG